MLFKEINGRILIGNMSLKESFVIISPESKIVCKAGENATLKKYMDSMSNKNSDFSSKYYLYLFSDALMSERYDRLILILNDLKKQNLQIQTKRGD